MDNRRQAVVRARVVEACRVYVVGDTEEGTTELNNLNRPSSIHSNNVMTSDALSTAFRGANSGILGDT